MKKYGLIGYPLGHSFSKVFFNQKFTSEGIDAEYVNFEIENVNDLKYVLRENPSLCGLNVTLPHKMNVIPLLDSITDNARNIGAVNVIKFKRGLLGKLHLEGHNSDITGFRKSIEPLLNETHRKALILGTGGASKAIYHGLKQLGIDPIFVSRTQEEFCITYNEITQNTMKNYTVIVNTTPVGMYPKSDICPDIPYKYVTPNHILYDLLYNPDETLFMKKGKDRGAIVKNGLEMLLLQAFASWEIWNA
ncbi:MAG: shikimate dehydrogenase [Dysgonamonadaceae bacterium]|jgi:shikimate dehydrogenase|nr:shikimate dehydrogenase [Dysgonamonadaceae bacterium]